MNKKVLTFGIALLMVAIVTATAVLFLFPYQPDQPPQTDDTGSTQSGIQQVVNANNQFAFDLYSKYKDDSKYKDANIFFSPYSISTALAMTYEGANGQTAEEMKSVFHFPEFDILRPNSAAIYNNINKKDKPYELMTGNALWAQYDYKFLEEYFSRVEQYYGGKVANLDFKQETEKSRQTINSFIEQQTNDRIKELLPKSPPVIKLDTRLVLTNAIYFKGDWVLQFDKKKTREADFKITPNQSVKAQMMTLTGEKAKFNYAETENLQILEMPYKGEELSMLVFLPREGTLDEFEQSLTLEKLNEWKNSLQERKIDVYMPKFKFETKYFMKEDLEQMGMPTAFSMAADFSGMDGTDRLYISQVIHQAFIEVNEEGTEAAAATAVIMAEKTAGFSNMFMADHPFIFMIQEKETGNILFLGRMSDPTKQ
jgi:serine protease inhibitor